MKQAKQRPGPAAAAPFAHLLGRAKAEEPVENDTDHTEEEKAKLDAWRAMAEDNPERKQKEGENDEEYAARMEEMDAEEGKAESGKDEGEEGKAESGKDEGEEGLEQSDGEADMEDGDENAKATRRTERARCARIMAYGMAQGCAHQAAVFAFESGMSSRQAVALLRASKADAGTAPKHSGLAGRMSKVKIPNVGANASERLDPSDPNAAAKAAADAIIKAAAKARGEKV